MLLERQANLHRQEVAAALEAGAADGEVSEEEAEEVEVDTCGATDADDDVEAARCCSLSSTSSSLSSKSASSSSSLPSSPLKLSPLPSSCTAPAGCAGDEEARE